MVYGVGGIQVVAMTPNLTTAALPVILVPSALAAAAG